MNTISIGSINLQSNWEENLAKLEHLIQKHKIDVVNVQDHGLTKNKIEKGFVGKPDQMKFSTYLFGYAPEKKANRSRTLGVCSAFCTQLDLVKMSQ